MRKIVLAAIFAIVSSITGAILAPVAYAQVGCAKVSPVTGKCEAWGTSYAPGGSNCFRVSAITGQCESWNSGTRTGYTCDGVDVVTGKCRSWSYAR